MTARLKRRTDIRFKRSAFGLQVAERIDEVRKWTGEGWAIAFREYLDAAAAQPLFGSHEVPSPGLGYWRRDRRKKA